MYTDVETPVRLPAFVGVELKRLSHINDRARAADRDPAFSSRIREELPGIP